MTRFILIRILQAFIALIGIMVLVFFLVRLSGDPTKLLQTPNSSAEQLEQIKHSLGLDRSVGTQFVIYIQHLAVGDFGNSFKANLAYDAWLFLNGFVQMDISLSPDELKGLMRYRDTLKMVIKRIPLKTFYAQIDLFATQINDVNLEIDHFKKCIKENYYYVDKLIKQLDYIIALLKA